MQNPALDVLPNKFSTKLLYGEPLLLYIENIIKDEEIEQLLKMAEGKYSHSTIVVDGKRIQSTRRTSQTAYVTDNGQHNRYSEPIERFLERITFLAGCKRSQVENLMVVKYEVGEQFTAHFDFFEPSFGPQLANGGQRIATFFVYLNTPSDTVVDNNVENNNQCGGETVFPHLNIKVKPHKNDGLFWWNKNRTTGELLRKTEHSGDKLLKGVKYGLNVWIRETGW